MRILQISSAEQFGGGERHVSQLCRALAGRGHQLELAVRPASPLPATLADCPAVRCHTVSLRGAADLLSAGRLARLIDAEKIELVHAHYARDYPLTALAVKFSVRKPAFFLTRHHYLPVRANWAYRRLLASLDCAIAVSNSVAATLQQSFHWHMPANNLTDASNGIAKPRLQVVPNWIDIPSFSLSDANRDSLRASFGLAAGALVVGCINQLAPAKGQAVLLVAAAKLSARFPQLQLILAGREHDPAAPFTAQLRRQAADAGLSQRVIFAGHTEALAELYQAIDIAVIPSENEAFSLVCLEAMASRRPVIASAVGGLAELVKDNETGLLFPAGDVDALAAKLAFAIDHPDRCRNYCQQAYRFISENFSQEIVIDRIEALYQQVLADKKK